MEQESDQSLTEVFSSPVAPGRGRKRHKVWKKTEMKSKRYKEEGKDPKVSCNHRGGFCNGQLLLQSDIDDFFKKLYDNPSKTAQDAFLVKYMSAAAPKRLRKGVPAVRTTIDYLIRRQNGSLVKVCAKTFRSVACVSENRLQRLARYHKAQGQFMPERRGGSRIKCWDLEVTESIKSWISNYKCRESHYGRSKSVRSYLPPELSLNRMWRDWKAYRAEKEQRSASISKFKGIFYKNFNLGFGNPRTDVCSFCQTHASAIRAESDALKKQRLITELRVHKIRAKRFHQLMATRTPGVLF
ncbi:hypothetical protein ElyMa_004856100 [Elysia marginata]|uniref:Uncharacterized protein n=1 Tax=Elysia marginata TaxID=1093978 RepID=A0AAV4IR74_9GAST|nr:hypothetical protein ElyMa_004856100 [Elysia marginata]